MWNSPVPEKRWAGQRTEFKGTTAFESLQNFEAATQKELEASLEEHELVNLGRLIQMGKKMELELFIRTHGANPIFDPQAELDVPVGVAHADKVDLFEPPSGEALEAILNGDILHVLFQAGEASRFQEGPFYALNPVTTAKKLCGYDSKQAGNGHTNGHEAMIEDLADILENIYEARAELPPDVGTLLVDLPLGPKQPLLLRAALRRIVQYMVASGEIKKGEASDVFAQALAQQKLLFFVSARGGVSEAHDEALRKQFKFFGFNPSHIVTIEQEPVHGLTADERGKISVLKDDAATDAAGHLYALLQAARTGGFTTYTESGRVIKPMETDAFSYLMQKGAKIMSVIRINDMDRHTPEIINPKALTYALRMFEKGYVNIIETVANPQGQKGGLGTTFGNPEIHVLTETHENSFPALSRPFEAAVQRYLEQTKGAFPAYNAMRQWADITSTRRVLREFGGRIVFVPRQKSLESGDILYLGADMPMGDLSLLFGNYKSRMFQFVGPNQQGLLIHDMKTKDNLVMALDVVDHQLNDPFVVATAEEICTGEPVNFEDEEPAALYGAPAPEFEEEAEE